MNLGVQYYRAPFPHARYWDEDFARIRDAGFNCVQLWVLWSWVESKPGEYRFEDYDALIELAAAKGLNVVLSTIAEVQPLWIHREEPGSEMIDHLGRRVVSTNRLEVHQGLTPGGCTDHPGVWERMAAFLTRVGERYRAEANLVGWDVWNELRWNVQSEGYVCYCPSTMRAFHDWLRMTYGDLDDLNAAWQRRYGAWDEVTPGRLPMRPFTEMMAFQHFLTWRANQHARDRAAVLRAADPNMAHAITVHPASPSPLETGGVASGNPNYMDYNQAINRGNDWFYADDLDGIGCSSFPKWSGESDADFAVRLRFMSSAARGKRMWLSELQGAAASTENVVHQPVEAREQQRWLWNGVAAGADTILFWCWRDEVFGREAGGFGIAGNDGYAARRLEAMGVTGRLLTQHKAVLAAFRPDPAEIGVLFSPQSYYLNFAQEGNARLAMQSLQAYCRALNRRQLAYEVIEEEHLAQLDHLKVLFLPRVQVFSEPLAHAIEAFVKRGGVVFAESEAGAWTPAGLWRYPEERLLARLTGVREVGRRVLPKHALQATVNDRNLILTMGQWLTPMTTGSGTALGHYRDGGGDTSLLSRVPVGDGTVWLAGTFLGNPPEGATPSSDFDELIEIVVRLAGVHVPIEVMKPAVKLGHAVQVNVGHSGGRRVAFVFTPANTGVVTLAMAPGFYGSGRAVDLLTGEKVMMKAADDGQQCEFHPGTWGVSILVEE